MENGNKSTEYTSYVVVPIFLEDKLDETLDSAITNLTLQPNDGSKEPFTKYKVELDDGTTTQTQYFVIASPDGDKARMSN